MSSSSSAQQSPPVPAEAFTVPTGTEVQNNPAYWQGYHLGQQFAMQIPGPIPSPAGTGSWDNYRAVCAYLQQPDTIDGFPQNNAVGYNQALNNAENWLWLNDPQSPHFIPPD